MRLPATAGELRTLLREGLGKRFQLLLDDDAVSGALTTTHLSGGVRAGCSSGSPRSKPRAN
jgi:hypothetical protein